jgi:ubiquinone/menaquinone biosynthesis C-methylase UbiE
VGFSSASTGHVVGVDTSPGMLGLARLRRPDVKFEEGNAETWGEDKCCDVVTVMFGMQRRLASCSTGSCVGPSSPT